MKVLIAKKTEQKRDCPQRSESASVDGTVPFLAALATRDIRFKLTLQ